MERNENPSCQLGIRSWFVSARPDKDQAHLQQHMTNCFRQLQRMHGEAHIANITDGISEEPELAKFSTPGMGDDFKREFIAQWKVYSRKPLFKKKR